MLPPSWQPVLQAVRNGFEEVPLLGLAGASCFFVSSRHRSWSGEEENPFSAYDEGDDGGSAKKQREAPTIFRSICSGMVGAYVGIKGHHVYTGR